MERWEEELREIEKVTGGAIMNDMLKKEGLHEIAVGKVKEEIDLEMTSKTCEELRNIVMQYAFRKKTQGKKRLHSTTAPTAGASEAEPASGKVPWPLLLRESIHHGSHKSAREDCL